MGKKMVRSKRSKAPGFRLAVIRALATTNQYVYEESQRVTWNANNKSSCLAYPTGGGAWGAEYFPIDIVGDLVTFVRQQIPLPNANGLAGFASGNPFDVYVTRTSVKMTVANCSQAPVFGRWYCFESRYDGQNVDPPNAYNNEITSYQGAVGGLSGVAPLTYNALASTPFSFRALCQSYKIRPMSKIFRLEPTKPRVFKHTSKHVCHVTPRMINLVAVKKTKFFGFEFWGGPVNDFAVNTRVGTAAGAVDIINEASIDYEYRPIPNSYKSNADDLGVITTASLMVNSNVTATNIANTSGVVSVS